MARPSKAPNTAPNTVVESNVEVPSDVDHPILMDKRYRLFDKYLELKRASMLGNAPNVTCLIYELAAFRGDRGYLYSASDIKAILTHFGIKMDFAVDAAIGERATVDQFEF